MIRCSTSSLDARGFQLRQEHRQGLRVAARRVGREHQVIGKASLNQRHHQRHLLRVVVAALTIEADERTAAADRLVHVDVRVNEIAEVADEHAIGLHAGIFQNVELFDRRFPRNARVRENRNVRRTMRPADGAEHLPLVRGDLIPRADFTKRPYHVVVDLPDERAEDLFLAHRGDLFGIPGLRVETAAHDDRHAGLRRHLAQERDVTPHVGMPGVDDAGDVAVASGGRDLRRHQVDVVHDVGTRRSSRAAGAAAARRSRRQSVRGPGRGRGREEFRQEIRRKLHVLVEQRGAACQLLGRIVPQDRSDDRAFGKRRRGSGRLRGYATGCHHRRRARSQPFQCLPASHAVCHGASIVGAQAR